jgi:hypothetical protein
MIGFSKMPFLNDGFCSNNMQGIRDHNEKGIEELHLVCKCHLVLQVLNPFTSFAYLHKIGRALQLEATLTMQANFGFDLPPDLGQSSSNLDASIRM